MRVYFVGAGGIGMANLVRYCLSKGDLTAGYDRTETALTRQLVEEGAEIVYTDDPALIPEPFRDPKETLVVYTPAVPADNKILTYFRDGGFEIIKRAALLGRLTDKTRPICVAGSHGKTTTSSMIALMMRYSKVDCNAFLGGILRNYDTNLLLSDSPWSVVEADEYDRSFHHLHPEIAVITSTDPDHLDIYGDEEHYLEAFSIFTSLIRPGGTLIMNHGIKLKPEVGPDVKIITYTDDLDYKTDVYAYDIRYDNGSLFFNYIWRNHYGIMDIELGSPARINVLNALAAITAALIAGVEIDDVRKAMRDFKGAKRRFEVHLRGNDNPGGHVLIDDYAHSPKEVEASIRSVRSMYPGRKVSVIFQPHLYSRTRDFAPEFARALSYADEVIMPEIYPAREKPIPGVTSEIIFKDVKSAKKTLTTRKDLANLIKNSNFDVLMTLGAADIDTAIPEIKQILIEKPKA